VCYRAGDWQGAITAPTESRKPPGTEDGTDCLVLALAHHQAGESAKAQACYERAAGLIPSLAHDRQSQRLHAEAVALLGRR
jgi:uncharacterized protein HemY